MSSSISGSDDRSVGAWTRWLASFAVTLGVGFFALYLLVLICDPFSTGRFTPLHGIDIAISQRALANAGRVRDPSFDAAIIGNSYATRFEPDRLNGLTRLRFVQLSIPGFGPDDQLTLARAFLRAHDGAAKAFVVFFDQYWCATNDADMLRYPRFPDWLYQNDDLAYLTHLFTIDAVQAALHRIAIRLGFAPEPARRDGYYPVEQRGIWRPERVAKLTTAKRPTAAPSSARIFPALDRLDALARSLDPKTALVLVLLPYHVSALPEPGTDAADWIDACKRRMRAIAQPRPRTEFLDWMVDGAVARDAANFWDATHARDHVIRSVEASIAEALARLDGR
jgi:hypothetical protein